MKCLGLKVHGHDTGAALIQSEGNDFKVVAISEARLDRTKHSRAYPLRSIDYCLQAFGIRNLDDIDIICIDKHGEGWTGSQYAIEDARQMRTGSWGYDALASYLIEQSIRLPTSKTHYVAHIDCHAASAFYASGFEDAAVLILEGGQGIFRGNAHELKVIDKLGYSGPIYNNGLKLNDSSIEVMNPSFFYDLITTKCGFDVFGCGKTMALSAFGHHYPRHDRINIPKNRFNDFLIDYREVYQKVERDILAFDAKTAAHGIESLLDEYWVNLARETQEALYEDMLYLAKLAKTKTESNNLCLAGGVALSCITNRVIADSGMFNDIFIQPAASDEGVALGAAYLGYQMLGGRCKPPRMDTVYLGSSYHKDEIPGLLSSFGLIFGASDDKLVAKLLADGKVIGRFFGASEYGPRALGNRSILADPRRPDMQEYVNRQIKHRENFRPFAPSCHADKAHRYFDLPMESPFMIMAAQVNPAMGEKIPAVVHVDNSTRVQTVRPEQNPGYYSLIGKFGDITGYYLLLNTSFNDNGEPIVETPEDAIRSFLTTGLDYLYIEGWLVSRPNYSGALAEIMSKSINRRKEMQLESLIEKHCDSSLLKRAVGRVAGTAA